MGRKITRTLAELDVAPVEFFETCPVEPKTWERPYPDTLRGDTWAYKKGRPRAKKKGDMILVTPAQTRHYEAAVRDWLRKRYGQTVPMSGDLRFEAEFFRPRPTGHKKDEIWSSVKPDIDNLARAFLEACDFRTYTEDDFRLGVLDHDAVITELVLSKRWSEDYEWPGTRFGITPADRGLIADPIELPDVPSPYKPIIITPKTILSTRMSALAPAPDVYARYWDIPPVAWQQTRLFGSRMGTPNETRAFQAAMRKRAIYDYWGDGIRRPMDGELGLVVEVLYADHPDRPWRAYMGLLDYCKSLMDIFDFHKRTNDNRRGRDETGFPLGVVANDSRIVALSANMRAAERGEKPGIRFAVWRLEDGDVDDLFSTIASGAPW